MAYGFNDDKSKVKISGLIGFMGGKSQAYLQPNTTEVIEFNVARTGYRPIALVYLSFDFTDGTYKSGVYFMGTDMTNVSTNYDNAKAGAKFRNTTSSVQNITIDYQVAYIKVD